MINPRADDMHECDLCGVTIEGEPAGRGLLLFVRGDTLLREEPPLCERCAHGVGVAAMKRWELEDEDG